MSWDKFDAERGHHPRTRKQIHTESLKKARAVKAARQQKVDDREAKVWIKQHPPKAENVTSMYKQATPQEIEDGMNWYKDAHYTAEAFSKQSGLSLSQTSGVLAAYSPQTAWATNMLRAARAIRTKKAVGGKGSGEFATEATKNKAQAIMDGGDYKTILTGRKINAFGQLIENGGDPDPLHPLVVVDRHALSVASGDRSGVDEYKAARLGTKAQYEKVSKAFTDAAAQLSKETGTPISAHQLQAITWLAQQRKNQEADLAVSSGKVAKSAAQARKAWDDWNEFAGVAFPGLDTAKTGYSLAGDEKWVIDLATGVSPGGRPIDESPLSDSKDSNYVAKRGGLPPYIRGVARGIDPANPDSGHAISMAIGAIKRWAAGGDHVHPAVQAAAAAALAQWEKVKNLSVEDAYIDLNWASFDAARVPTGKPPGPVPAGGAAVAAGVAPAQGAAGGAAPVAVPPAPNGTTTLAVPNTPEVIAAIQKYQKDNGLQVTGTLNAQTVAHARNAPAAAAAAKGSKKSAAASKKAASAKTSAAKKAAAAQKKAASAQAAKSKRAAAAQKKAQSAQVRAQKRAAVAQRRAQHAAATAQKHAQRLAAAKAHHAVTAAHKAAALKARAQRQAAAKTAHAARLAASKAKQKVALQKRNAAAAAKAARAAAAAAKKSGTVVKTTTTTVKSGVGKLPTRTVNSGKIVKTATGNKLNTLPKAPSKNAKGAVKAATRAGRVAGKSATTTGQNVYAKGA